MVLYSYKGEVMSIMPSYYIEELEYLRKILEWLLRKDLLQDLVDLKELLDKSYVHKYTELVEKIEQGEDCGFAKKAQDLFYTFQEKNISDKIKQIYESYIRGVKE